MISTVLVAHFTFIGDGTSTSIVINLEKDPFVVANASPANLFTSDAKTKFPTGAVCFDPNVSSVTLTGAQLTVNFTTAFVRVAENDIYLQF